MVQMACHREVRLVVSDVKIKTLNTPQEIIEVIDLHRLVWPGSDTALIPPRTYLEIAHNGGILLGAYDSYRLVGYALGFPGITEQKSGTDLKDRLKHYSHILCVHPEFRNRGVGFRLKVAQRKEVIRQGFSLINWTVDPLLSNNAHLNVHRLGAVCNTYLREYYGQMQDGLNRGLPSDRFRMDWWITSARVEARLDERINPSYQMDIYPGEGKIINPSIIRENGLVEPASEVVEPAEDTILVEIPADFLAMKRADIGLAHAWRIHSRDIFERVFASGYSVTGFVHRVICAYPHSYYVLTRDGSMS